MTTSLLNYNEKFAKPGTKIMNGVASNNNLHHQGLTSTKRLNGRGSICGIMKADELVMALR